METKELNGKELVEALLLGSAEIDRMRKKIDQVVHMIVGFMLTSFKIHTFEWLRREDTTAKISSSTCYWTIEFEYRKGDRCLIVECFVGWGQGGFKSAYSTHRGFRPRHDEVKAVYDDLPLFVEGMVKEFPFLTEYWQSFLDAASAAKQRG